MMTRESEVPPTRCLAIHAPRHNPDPHKTCTPETGTGLTERSSDIYGTFTVTHCMDPSRYQNAARLRRDAITRAQQQTQQGGWMQHSRVARALSPIPEAEDVALKSGTRRPTTIVRLPRIGDKKQERRTSLSEIRKGSRNQERRSSLPVVRRGSQNHEGRRGALSEGSVSHIARNTEIRGR